MGSVAGRGVDDVGTGGDDTGTLVGDGSSRDCSSRSVAHCVRDYMTVTCACEHNTYTSYTCNRHTCTYYNYN